MCPPAGFRRPVVIFGPISDAVNEKLATDLPNDFIVASKSQKCFANSKKSIHSEHLTSFVHL